MCWPIAASINCRTTRRWWYPESLCPQARRGVALLESVPSVYSTTGCDGAADGGDHACRYCELHAIAGVGASAGGLSHDSNPDVLSRGKSGCGGNDGDGAAGAAVWTAPGSEPDDVEQFGRDFRRGAAV